MHQVASEIICIKKLMNEESVTHDCNFLKKCILETYYEFKRSVLLDCVCIVAARARKYVSKFLITYDKVNK